MNIEIKETNKEYIKILKLKNKVKNKAKYICKYCNCNNKLIMTIDHIIPISRGGNPEDEKNMVCCCIICNQLKNNLLEDEFKDYLIALNTMKDLSKLTIPAFDVKLNFRK